MTRRVATLVPVGFALALYAVTLDFDRTFDDIHQIPAPGEPTLRTLGDVWNSPYWSDLIGAGLYRPVTSTTYWLEGRLDLPLPVRHAVNVGLHAAITGLAVRLALGLGLGTGASGLVGILFALHPAHVEVVAGLVGRAELLAALFMLLALFLHDRLLSGPTTGKSRDPRHILWHSSLGCLAFLAASSKESAWLLPLFAFSWIAVRHREGLRSLGPWFAYAAGISVHLLLRRAVLGGWLNAPQVVIDPGDNPLVRLDGLERMVGGLRVLGLCLGHLVLPWTMSPDYSGSVVNLGGGWVDPRLWGGLLFLGGSAYLAGWGLGARRSAAGPAFAVAGGWLLVSVLTSLNLILDLGTVLAERLLFWPSLAWSLALGGAMAAIAGLGTSKVPGIFPARLRMGAIALSAAMCLVYLALTIRYLPVWRNDATLFTAAIRTAPGSSRVWYNYGRALQEEGDPSAALVAYARAKTLAPDDYQVWAQEAVAWLQMKKTAEAESALAQALRLEPRDPVSRVNEGVLWMERGDIERAAHRFREVLGQHPERTEALMNLALAEGRLGRATEAQMHWRAYLTRHPRDAAALNNLAWLLATSLNRPREAEPLARDAVALRPGEPNLRDTLAEALLRQGRAEEAEAVALEALSLGPDPELARSLGRFLTPSDSTAARPQ